MRPNKNVLDHPAIEYPREAPFIFLPVNLSLTSIIKRNVHLPNADELSEKLHLLLKLRMRSSRPQRIDDRKKRIRDVR